MVVIGKIPLTRKRNVTNESQSAASNEVIIEGTKKKRNYAFTTYKNKSKKLLNQINFACQLQKE